MTLVELVITLSIILLITTLCFPSDNVEKYQVNSFIKQLCSDIRYVRNINMMGNTNAYVYLNNNDEGSSFTLNENKKDEFIHVSNLTPNTFEFPEITNNQIENKTEETTNLDSLLNGTISLDNISLNNDEEEEIEVMDDNNEEVLEVKADIDTAIEKVEKLVEELKELGLEVNLEKYDFDELYQFVIKVERK